jgi:hypothetical protein
MSTDVYAVHGFCASVGVCVPNDAQIKVIAGDQAAEITFSDTFGSGDVYMTINSKALRKLADLTTAAVLELDGV